MSTAEPTSEADEMKKMWREFAAKRSHQDAQQSNENWRLSAQASMLVNGGAATALLALLAKEKVPIAVLQWAPVSLIFFAVGVLASAYVLYCMKHALKHWNQSWQRVIESGDPRSGDKQHEDAMIWYERANRQLLFSLIVFALGAAWAAVVLVCAGLDNG